MLKLALEYYFCRSTGSVLQHKQSSNGSTQAWSGQGLPLFSCLQIPYLPYISQFWKSTTFTLCWKYSTVCQLSFSEHTEDHHYFCALNALVLALVNKHISHEQRLKGLVFSWAGMFHIDGKRLGILFLPSSNGFLLAIHTIVWVK